MPKSTRVDGVESVTGNVEGVIKWVAIIFFPVSPLAVGKGMG